MCHKKYSTRCFVGRAARRVRDARGAGLAGDDRLRAASHSRPVRWPYGTLFVDLALLCLAYVRDIIFVQLIWI